MTKKQVEQREKALKRSFGICYVCGKPLLTGQMQYAHKIGNTETNRKLYGAFFIDSTFNGELVCSLECNHSLDVGKDKPAILSTLIDILTKETKEFNNGN